MKKSFCFLFSIFVSVFLLSCKPNATQNNNTMNNNIDIKDTLLLDFTEINILFDKTLAYILFELKQDALVAVDSLQVRLEHLKTKYKQMQTDDNQLIIKNAFVEYLQALCSFVNGYFSVMMSYFDFAETLEELTDELYFELDELVRDMSIKKTIRQENFHNILQQNNVSPKDKNNDF
jgi:hypothetical protein